jgi:hypothetical protein
VLSTLIAAVNALPLYGYIPSGIGSSVSYRYEASTTGNASASGSVHAVVTVTRISDDEVRVDAHQEGVQASRPVTAMIREDGTLQALSQNAAGSTALPSPTPTASPRQRRSAPATFVPLASPRPSAPQRESVPEPISQTAALLTAAAAEGTFPRTWSHALSSNSVPFVLSLARNDDGASSTFVADGGGSGNLIHIEAIVRGGRFVSAHGTLRVVTSDMDQTQTLTTIWSITPAPSS